MAYVFAIMVVNKSMDPMFTHLNKRGIVTCYWVLNNDDEILEVANNRSTLGIMTDKPRRVKEMLLQRESALKQM